MNRDGAGDKIGFGGEDIPIFSNSRDLPGALKLAQFMSEGDALVRFEAELARDFDLVQRPIVSVPQKSEYGLSDFSTAFCHCGVRIPCEEALSDLAMKNRR
jgi:hypothetical protein